MNRLIISLIILSLTSIAYAKKHYSFGIVPQQAATKLVRNWNPIFKYIEQKTGIKLQFSTKKNIPTFEDACAVGEYDFVYMNPYHYIQFHDYSGYQAIAKARDKKIKGIIVVQKGSKIRSLNDLAGKTLAFPSDRAFAASLIPRAALKSHGIKFESRYVGSHDSVYYNIAAGIYVAGGGVMRTFKAASPGVRKKLKVLWTSGGYTPHAFAVHPRVAKAVVQKVQQALINLEQSQQGRDLLQKLKLKGIESAKNSDWDDIRQLKFY